MGNSKWPSYEFGITLYKVISEIDIKKTFQENIVTIFERLLQEFFLLLNKEQGIHLFFSSDFSEAHFLFSKSPSSKKSPYTKTTDNELLKWIKKYKLKDSVDSDSLPRIIKLKEAQFIGILHKLCPEIISKNESIELTFLPFNFRELNLGYFILWGIRNENKSVEFEKTTLQGYLSSWYTCLSQYIQKMFKVSRNIYLPEYFTTGWKQVAVLFADIRNFTPLVEILRNRGGHSHSSEILQKIITSFYKEMSGIVCRYSNGRIDKFLGDGIMVIFGEQKSKTGDAACDALHVAAKMIQKFDELKDDWQQQAFGADFEKEYNETVEIGLGIGIDYGSVYFELLGDKNHQEYSAVGDHVNFASRLQGYAAKDNEKNGKYPPIILSRTAHCCCKNWLTKNEHIRLPLKGKAYTYNCYGIYPEDLIDDRFFNIEENKEESALPVNEAADRDAIEASAPDGVD